MSLTAFIRIQVHGSDRQHAQIGDQTVPVLPPSPRRADQDVDRTTWLRTGTEGDGVLAHAQGATPDGQFSLVDVRRRLQQVRRRRGRADASTARSESRSRPADERRCRRRLLALQLDRSEQHGRPHLAHAVLDGPPEHRILAAGPACSSLLRNSPDIAARCACDLAVGPESAPSVSWAAAGQARVFQDAPRSLFISRCLCRVRLQPRGASSLAVLHASVASEPCSQQ